MKHLYTTLLLVLVTSFASAQKSGIDEITDSYKQYYDAKEYDKAVPFLEELDSMNALDSNSLKALMHCYYMVDDSEKSISTANRWLKEYENQSDPDKNSLAYGILADVNYFNDNFKEATLYYSKLVNIKRDKPYENIWNVFMLGLCEYEEGQYEDMKRYCMTAILENCRHFEVTINDIWDDKVENGDIALMFYHFALALYEVKGNRNEGDAAMQLSAKCGYEEAKRFVKQFKTPCRPQKSKLFCKQ